MGRSRPIADLTPCSARRYNLGMRRPPAPHGKKGTDRRKKPRTRSSAGQGKHAGARRGHTGARGHSTPTDGAEPPRSSRKSRLEEQRARQDCCENCGKGLSGSDRALFVEEEVGRIFCSEDCIAAFFAPEISRLEKEYFRRLSSGDLTAEDREGLAHLRWITLQEPDEVWREKTISGDYRYTLISEFQPGAKRVWCICICLFLRGEPSFLYLAFPTKNAAMANHYRRGERVQWTRLGHGKKRRTAAELEQAAMTEQREAQPDEDGESSPELRHDRLAPAWTEDETFMAQMNQERSPGDIGPDEFGLYQSCLEETLEEPDEVWSIRMGDSSEGGPPPCIYHFIRHYPDESPGIWYIIIARETDDDEEQIEIMDAFPTRDAQLVERYRRGELEVGQVSSRSPAARVVH